MQIIEISEPGASSKKEENQIAVGIDFGTTNSLIAISTLQSARVIKAANGQELIPSIIEFKDGNFVIGQNGIASIKRLFGKTREEIINTPTLFAIVKDFIDMQSEAVKLNFANRLMTIPEIAAQFFLHLKLQAEKDLATNITKAVITVPAHFNDAARGEIMLAAKLAGFDVLRLIAEPTAAAYAYGLSKKQEGCYLVYDFGGGTFDVSILNMQAGVFQIIATDGQDLLGGEEIDYLIEPHLKIDILLAKRIKETLTYQDEFNEGNISFDKKAFEELISGLIKLTIWYVEKALQHAGNPHIDGIILVGGTTRIPLIADMLKKTFNVPILRDIDPDKAVALGAALQAENLTSSIAKSLVIDVVPLSVGMELYGGIVEKIILRNSAMPISVTKEFTTFADNQTAIQIHILQGEREMVEDCRSLARFELNNLPLMKAGGVRVEVTFSIDADGILSVSALEKITGKFHTIELKPTYGLKKSEINRILEESYKNVRTDHVNRLLQETIIHAQSLIYNVEKAIKEMPDLLPMSEMKNIHKAIKTLKEIIRTGDRGLIIKHCQAFEITIKKFTSYRLNLSAKDLLTGKHVNHIR